jgi:O-antigen/teichoic acid export membrane protein
LKTILNRLPIKGEFAKNALTLITGTSIAQAIPMLFYPVLGRIFSPVQFGVLATLTSIYTILAVIATGNYENTILIASTKKDAANIVGLILLLSSSFLIISFIVLQIYSNQISIWFNEPSLKKWLFVCPISAFALIIYYCYNEWCVRNKYFVKLSLNKITNSGATTLSKLLFGFVKVVSNGLVIGDLIGRLISAGACVFRALQKDRREFFQMSFKQMRHLAKRFVGFPKFSLPAQIFNTIGVSLPVLFIGAYFNSTEVGYYAMAMNILGVPISIISLTIKDVFRQRANEEYLKTGSCLNIFKRLLKVLILSGSLGSIILIFILPGVFSLFLGEKWRIAGEYSQILLPMMAIDFVCISLSGVFFITEKMKMFTYLELYYLVITIVSLLFGSIIFHGIKSALISFAIGRSSAYLLFILISYNYSKGNIKKIQAK